MQRRKEKIAKKSSVRNAGILMCAKIQEEVMFKFKINNDIWQIEEKDKEELKEIYEKETQEKTYYLYKQ